MPEPDSTGKSIVAAVNRVMDFFGLKHKQLLSCTTDSASNCLKVSLIVSLSF